MYRCVILLLEPMNEMVGETSLDVECVSCVNMFWLHVHEYLFMLNIHVEFYFRHMASRSM